MQEQQPPINEASPMAAVSGESEEPPPPPRFDPGVAREAYQPITRNVADLIGGLTLLILPFAFLGFVWVVVVAVQTDPDLTPMFVVGGYWGALLLAGAGLLTWSWWRGRQQMWEVSLAWIAASTFTYVVPMLFLFWGRFRRWMAEMFASWHPAWRANEPESLKLAAIRIVAFAIVPVVAIWGPLVVAAAAFGSGQPQTATVSNCEDYALRYYGVGVDRVEVEWAALDLPGRWWVAECGSGAGGTWIALVTEWDYGESRSALRSGLPWNVRGVKLFTRDLASAPEARSRMYEDFLKFLEHQLGEPSESAAYQHAQASARAVSALGLDCVLRSSTAEYIERAGREGEIFVETIRGIGCVLHRKEYPGGYFYLEWLVMVAPGVTGPSGADLEEELFEIVEWLELGPVER